ncbi:AI-2E family transporter [Parvularcula maris]|uniref:AI-2E family transporter n=1 Tax=Parvularcula maris TaxID=2965077 RepID=A0A9X2L8E4_9PROT|nr:AI-2E family transporter [Parvularcula maris]
MTTPLTRDARRPRRSLASFFFGVAIFVLIGFILWIGQGVLIPLVIAAFLSFLIVTVKRGIDRAPGVGKRLPEAVSFALSFGVIVLIMFLLAAIIRNNIEAVVAAAPSYSARLIEIWRELTSFTGSLPFGADIQAGLANLENNLVEMIGGYAGDVATIARGVVGGLITVLLYTVFILAERGRVLNKIVKIAGPHGAEHVVSEVIEDIQVLVRTYISVKTLTSLTVAAISFVIMALLEIDFAGFWALLIFALNFIPVIGSIIAVLLPTFLALVQPGGGLGLFILTGVLLTAAEQLVGTLIEPRMMGRSLNLSPLVILISLAAWGSLWGIAGAFLCVPMTVALMIILAQFESTRPVAVLLSDNGEVEPLKRGEPGKTKAGGKALKA